MEHGHVEDVGASNVGTLLACTWCGPTALFCVVLFQWASMIPPSQLRASPHERGHTVALKTFLKKKHLQLEAFSAIPNHFFLQTATYRY